MPETHVPDAVAELLAHRIQTSVRELEGALHSLVAHALLTGKRLDLALCVALQLIRATEHDPENW